MEAEVGKEVTGGAGKLSCEKAQSDPATGSQPNGAPTGPHTSVPRRWPGERGVVCVRTRSNKRVDNGAL